MARLRHQNSAANREFVVAAKVVVNEGYADVWWGSQAERLDGYRPVWPDVGYRSGPSAKLERMVLCDRIDV